MTGQDWLEKDFYQVLGVSKDADAAAVKKAYRKLARKLHPDQNPGDAVAEQRFKEVGEAYAVLSDPEQRKQYDSLRAMAGGGPRFTAGSGGASGANFEDLFGGMFGGAAPGGTRVRYSTTGPGGSAGPGGAAGFEDILSGMFGGGGFGPGGRTAGPERGPDLTTSARLPFRNAVEGATVTLTVDGRSMTVRIPPGVRDGQKIRLRGKGLPGVGGGAPGDLVVTVGVDPHPVFTADGDNLRITVPVTFAEAALGAAIDVPTFDGGTVRVKVPAGTPSGRTLRVKGRGISTAKHTGDLLVTIEVAVPARLTDDAKAAVEAFAAATNGEDPRAALAAEAAR
ncbi:chaperone DnaJ domain protein [Beutenbergia cavernae DSM 12333]|uniref:Chaperone DnaJ domain protein n=1 Tax=Beutenbergia cavernae (strain ATCC BAA-8 / DSM 12333 / CCUG 43141 / JCM 11478 / NBRC 16432 / NCIMB 13614 / HKI 0122) TaxID=471853 RepID=C5C3P0_BEUC1|nr:DnaJ C-terminal domain-containing protein [Beutenbergia cavernae]ACQ81949.1 chaperone DnaJ domain protein [Beutenbergia cavernae DSM 12333]